MEDPSFAVGNVREVKVYYMHHTDGLSRLTPVLLMEGGRIWQAGINFQFL